MADLETKLRALADAGNFSHLSILSSNGGFCASFSPASSWGRGHSEVHADPVVAALEAIERAPKERKVSRGVKVHSPVPDSAAEATQAMPATPKPSLDPGQANEPRPSLMGLFTNEGNDD